MKKIGIYVCGNVSKRCTANGCLRAFNENGCDEDPMESLLVKIEKFIKANVDTIHLSSCIRGRCDHYQEFVDELSKYFDVIGYTHGTAEGKRNNNINKKRIIPIEE